MGVNAPLQECFLVSFTRLFFLAIMRHDINKKKIFHIFKKNKIIKEIVKYCAAKKLQIRFRQ